MTEINDDDDELLPFRSPELKKYLPFGNTKRYGEINAGRLIAVKIGSRTFVTRGEARRYGKNLKRIAARDAASEA